MGRGRKGTGVEARDSHIRVRFTFENDRCYEPLQMAPTPPNMRFAIKLVETIRKRIDAGTFDYAEFFPNSKRVASGPDNRSLRHFGELWLQSKGTKASATKSQYRNALEFWYAMLGDKTDVGKISAGTLAAKVGSHKWPSNRLHNNYMIVLRGLFATASRDLRIPDPTTIIENGKVQKKKPDPLSLEEMDLILNDLRKHYDVRIWAYFAWAFGTGQRPEEIIAQQWPDVDFRHQTSRVERARSFRGEVKPIKTYQERDVDLVERALEALDAMKSFTFMKGEFIFENPVTGRPWHDERSQRDHYWTPCLKRLGIRYRTPYNARHTYATIALMAGANPNYVARQMGHKNAKMLFEVYSKWIDGADRGREKAKVEAALRGEFGPTLAPESENAGRRDWTRSNDGKISPLRKKFKVSA
jgi:integrase